MSHTITYLDLKPPRTHGALCKCGWRADPQVTRQAVEDEVLRHEMFVQRVRTQLRVKNPTLRSQRDHYRNMADDETIRESERRLWKQLADELDARLNDSGAEHGEQVALPFEVARKTRSDTS